MANEMMDLFLRSRENKEGENIKEKRRLLLEQRVAVEQELSTYQTTLNNIKD